MKIVYTVEVNKIINDKRTQSTVFNSTITFINSDSVYVLDIVVYKIRTKYISTQMLYILL